MIMAERVSIKPQLNESSVTTLKKAIIMVLNLVVLSLRSSSNQVEIRLVKSVIIIPSFVPICKVLCSANMKVC